MKYLLSTLALLCSISLFAQHETLLDDIDVIGGFGDLFLKLVKSMAKSAQMSVVAVHFYSMAFS
jgi:hypothetical protein